MQGAGGGDDDDNDIHYGFRQSRRDISYQYRDSSSLTPAQMMEREVYLQYAEDALVRATHIAHLITILFAVYNNLRAQVSQYTTSLTESLADIVSAAEARMLLVKEHLNKLLFLLMWIKAHGEIALLYIEDLSIFIRRRHQYQPNRFRAICEIDRGDCYQWFGLAPSDMIRLFVQWRVPLVLTTSSRCRYGGEECFLVFMFHMIKGVPFTEMARHTFGGDPRRLSEMHHLMVNHLYTTFYNKISGTSLDQWVPVHLDRCRRLIYDALSDGALEEVEYENGEIVDRRRIHHHFDFDSFRPFGFLDDFGMPTATPGIWARRNNDFQHDIQRAFYSGYLRKHGLKAQVVYLPIGIIGSVFITELRQNDNGVQNISGLNNYLLELLRGIFVGGLFPCLYCDGIFSVLSTILPRFTNPTPELHQLNMRLASLRQCIEHVFADHRIRFKIFAVPHYLSLFNNGVKVRRMCLVSFFVLNCYYCICGTRCRYFGHIPPTLEDYLPLDEVLHPPPAVNLGNVWDYGLEDI